MSRAGRMLALVLGASALAGAAAGQTPPTSGNIGDNAADAPSLAPPPAVDASRATSLKGGDVPAPVGPSPQAGANVAPGVTVTGRLDKPCSARDQACIDRVSAEIWKRYPQQIATMCNRQRVYAMQEGFTEDQLQIDGVKNDHLTPQTQSLCEYGRKLKAAGAAQAQ